jgi:N6-L-threonylcarbamoyladenine synthase
LFRDGHKCRGEKDCKNTVLNVHHIESQKTGGDAPNNLITLCEVCHHSYHKGELKLSLKRGQKFNDTTFMGIMKWSFYNKLKELYPNVKNTYGYITKSIRIDNKITKTHVTDAYCITKNIQAKRLSSYFMVNQVRKKKRSLHEETARKGRNKPNVLSKRNSKNTKQISHKNKLWCLNDKVELNEQIGFISGFSGNTVYIQDIKGQYLQSSPKYKQNNTDIIRLIERNNNWVYQEVSIQQLISSHD